MLFAWEPTDLLAVLLCTWKSPHERLRTSSRSSLWQRWANFLTAGPQEVLRFVKEQMVEMF